jgi:hypothetical protein
MVNTLFPLIFAVRYIRRLLMIRSTARIGNSAASRELALQPA